MPNAPVSPSQLADWLIARGQHFATTDQIAGLVGVDASTVPISLQRARKIVSVTKGGWVPVPPEYREAGAPRDRLPRPDDATPRPPVLHRVPVCRRLYGVSHQAPMALQVAAPALLRNRRIGGSRIEFIRRASTAARPTNDTMCQPVGSSPPTPAVAVLDLVESPQHGAGLGNVATVIGDLLDGEMLNEQALVDLAPDYPMRVV